MRISVKLEKQDGMCWQMTAPSMVTESKERYIEKTPPLADYVLPIA